MAFTSEYKDRCGGLWTSWDGAARLFGQLAKDVARREDDARVRREADAAGGELHVRATVVDSLSRSFRTIVPIECVADKHESPHFANLYDMALKYADVVPVSEVLDYLGKLKAA